jgi:hypothetical protein
MDHSKQIPPQLGRLKRQVEAQKYPPAYRRALGRGKTQSQRAYRKAASLPKLGYPFRVVMGVAYGPKILQRVEGLERKVKLLEGRLAALEEDGHDGHEGKKSGGK